MGWLKHSFSQKGFAVAFLVAVAFTPLLRAASQATAVVPLKAICQIDKLTPVVIHKITEHGFLETNDGEILHLADLFLGSPIKRADFENHIDQVIYGPLAGNTVLIDRSGPTDRYGRLPVQVFIPKEKDTTLWLQEWLIENNRAVFMPNQHTKVLKNTACDRKKVLEVLSKIKPLAAGYAGRPEFKVRAANDRSLWQQDGRFAVVQGTVTDVLRRRRHTLITFGTNVKNDFTVYVSNEVRKELSEQHGPLAKMIGKTVMVRGYLDLFDGPQIQLGTVWQLELEGE